MAGQRVYTGALCPQSIRKTARFASDAETPSCRLVLRFSRSVICERYPLRDEVHKRIGHVVQQLSSRPRVTAGRTKPTGL